MLNPRHSTQPTAALTALLLLAACNRSQKAAPYVILESHASKYVLRNPVSQSGPEPSTYVIRHGNVIIHAHCGTLARYDGRYDNCTSFPDPVLPIGEPLTMFRDSYGLCWNPEKDRGRDGACFVIDTEKVQEQ